MPSGRSLNRATRGAIDALHKCSGMSFDQIASVLQVSQETARLTYKRIKERAQGVNIRDLLNACDMENKKREEPAVPQKFPTGSEVSRRLKTLATQDKEHRLRTFPQIAREASVQSANSTIYQIMHEHHNLYRYLPRLKPALNANARENWLRFVEWALGQLVEVFVYSDEMILEALNGQIDNYNANRGANEPRRLHRRPYWGFKEEISARSISRGMDWFMYQRQGADASWLKIMREIILRLHEWITKPKSVELDVFYSGQQIHRI
ncbi:hypothetical protein B9Z19DRAFT_1124199 [Tuber borchii]|uniref:Uncharacterized protein n=1 Tax=Tuber borchii TaxID=42251 RepID=A0A2T6ZX18_TUBBO|nr:hypothetical protein B9Z19DRAFT_1124199 [Tuber borchii]